MVITRLRGESEVADDDGTVPNRTRHSVMRSPMSAEATLSLELHQPAATLTRPGAVIARLS